MSILREIESKSSSKLVIPRAGKMFKSNTKTKDKALAFCINKGYFETDELVNMIEILNHIQGNETIILVGYVEKVQSDQLRYRQRVFFKSLKEMLSVCKKFGIKVIFPLDFHIDINCVMNILNELPYLERYAHSFGETIEEYLTNTFFIQMHYTLNSVNMYSDLADRVNYILRDKEGYMNRAPFLISSYNIDRKSSSVFLNLDFDDKRLFNCTMTPDIDDIDYGFTDKIVEKDRKAGVFK